MREGSTWEVPPPSRPAPRGTGVASATSAGILPGKVKLRISGRGPRPWKRAAGSTESSTIFVPPSSNSAWRTATSRRRLRPEVAVRHALFEDGGTNIVDDSVEPAARFQGRGPRPEMRNFTLPGKMPAEVALATPVPRGAGLEGGGTSQVDPSRMDVSVRLRGVALAPAQPYLPVGARVTGNVDGEAQISARFDPFALSLRGSAAVNELGIGDANRQLLTADHARAEGVDVQWPGGVRVTRMEIAKPWVLFERETSGRFPLVDLLTPRARAAPKPRTSRDPGPRDRKITRLNSSHVRI